MRRIFLLMTLLLLAFRAIAQEVTLAELLAERPELSQFLEILELADPSLLETLNQPDADITVFAPTNAAFETFTTDLETPDSWQAFVVGTDSFETMLDNSEFLTQLASFHLLDRRLSWDDLLLNIQQSGYVHYLTMDAGYISITGVIDNGGNIVMENGIYILESNPAYIDLGSLGLEASNGLLYLIDYPLFPETRTIGEMIAEDASYGEEEGEFLRLMELINAADPSILELLSDPEANLTLFAPYDNAFEDFADFDQLLADSEAATAFISRYMLSETIYSFQLEEAQEVETLGGDFLSLVPDENAFYGEFFVNDSYPFFLDRQARNGVIHEMETLIE